MTINIDFADIANVMRNSGIAHMGIGEASGENRLLKALQQAIHSPILETSIKNASQIIMSVMGGEDLSIHEVHNYGTLVKDVLDDNCNIIFGVDLNKEFNDKIRIIIIATGFSAGNPMQQIVQPHVEQKVQSPVIVEKAVEVKGAKQADDHLPPYIRKLRGK